MMLISRINNSAKGAATLAGLTGMGFALMMVGRSIAMLGAMKTDELIQGGVAVGVLMIILGVVASAVGALSSQGLKGAVLLITFGLLLKTLALTIVGYAVMPWATYQDGMWKIVGVLAAMVIAARIISKADDNVLKAAGSMILMSVALKLMTTAIQAMYILLREDPVAAMGSMIVLAVGLIAMAEALTLLSAFEGSIIKASVSIGILTTCLFGIALAIGALNLVTLGNPLNSVISGVILIGMLYVMAKALQMLGNKTRQLPNATRGIFNMVIAIGVITGALTVLSSSKHQQNPDNRCRN